MNKRCHKQCYLDVSKATGADGLSASYIKEVAELIAPPLTALYNQSLWDVVQKLLK